MQASENIDVRIQTIDFGDFIARLEPADFIRAAKTLLEQGFDAFQAYRGDETEARRLQAESAYSFLLHIADTALHGVVDVQGQEQAADHVQMLRASGHTPAKRWQHFWSAERVAAQYNRLKTHLKKQPDSPILSMFVNECHIDLHHGVTVRAAFANGEMSWRTDPFDDRGGAPEIVLGVHDWLSPSLSRSRERATNSARYGIGDSSVLDRADNELAIVADDWCTLLTDDHDPELLILPENGETGDDYRDWIRDELGFEARMKSGVHLLAVGQEAAERLSIRFEQELAPYLRESKAGMLEARRILAHMNAALALLDGQGQPVTFGPNHNIKYDIELAMASAFRELFAGQSIRPDKYRSRLTIEDCRRAGIRPHPEQIASRVYAAIADHHLSALITPEELRETIDDEVYANLNDS